jgi:hypothetical protein
METGELVRLRPEQQSLAGGAHQPRGERRRFLHLIAQREVGQQEADAVVALAGQLGAGRILGSGEAGGLGV